MEHTPYIYWDISPELFSFGPFTVRWYGIFFSLSFLLGLRIMHWIFRRENKPEKDLDCLFYHVILGSVVGARMGYCLIYNPEYYFNHPFEIMKIWEGGLSSHGGGIGVFTALYFYTRRRPGQSLLRMLDRIAIPAALSGCFIRIGNLFNSEIVGVSTSVSWAFVFLRIDLQPRHPVQLYEAISYGLLFLLLLNVYQKKNTKLQHGVLLGLFLVVLSTTRFCLEFLKTRQASYDTELPFSIGQWLSIPAIVIGLVLLRNKRSFGVIRGFKDNV